MEVSGLQQVFMLHDKYCADEGGWLQDERYIEVKAVTGCCRGMHSCSFLKAFFIFSSFICKCEDLSTYENNFTCYFIWLWNLSSHPKGKQVEMGGNRMLSRLFWPEGREVTKGWRTCHNFYPSLIISTKVIKLRKMRWVEHVTCMRYEKCIQNFSEREETTQKTHT
jgi:hypothetical protein